MAQLLDLLRVATPPPPAKPPAVTLRDVLLLTALGHSLASAATPAPFSDVDQQVFKVLHISESGVQRTRYGKWRPQVVLLLWEVWTARGASTHRWHCDAGCLGGRHDARR